MFGGLDLSLHKGKLYSPQVTLYLCFKGLKQPWLLLFPDEMLFYYFLTQIVGFMLAKDQFFLVFLIGEQMKIKNLTLEHVILNFVRVYTGIIWLGVYFYWYHVHKYLKRV